MRRKRAGGDSGRGSRRLLSLRRFTLYNLTPGKTNIVETSTNLVNWSGIATNVPTIAMSHFTNNALASPTGRFYRSRSCRSGVSAERRSTGF